MALGATLDDLGDFATTPNQNGPARIETKVGENEVVIQQNVEDDFDTLNEHVCYTLYRDLKSIAQKTLYVLIPWRCSKEGKNRLRDWDLWGPLLICLLLATCLAYTAGDKTEDGQTALLFAIVFIIIWVGSAIVTINAVLLGSEKLGFFQSVCVLGYCCAPIAIASFVNAFPLPKWVEYLVGGIAFFLVNASFNWIFVARYPSRQARFSPLSCSSLLSRLVLVGYGTIRGLGWGYVSIGCC